MTTLGIDFDNTIVIYDKLFKEIALKRKLVTNNIDEDKKIIRDYLRKKGMEREYTNMQGEIYGVEIKNADPADGLIETLRKLKTSGVKMKLISHKTKYPYEGPKHDLQEAAKKWLRDKKISYGAEALIDEKDVYFEETKDRKLMRIEEQECDYFIDDLQEIIDILPKGIKGIHYDQKEYSAGKKDGIIRVSSWKEVVTYVI